eukprot:jgi/Chlat1/3394/Chrsp23S03727
MSSLRVDIIAKGIVGVVHGDGGGGGGVDMATELEELAGFLNDPRLEVRRSAVDIVKGLTGSQDGLRQLAGVPDLVLPPLLKRLGDADTGAGAATALVNLAQVEELAARMARDNAVDRAMECVVDRDCGHRGVLVMLLTNLTQTEPGAVKLLQAVNNPKLFGLHILRLARLFAKDVPQDVSEEGAEDEFAHVASVLANISRLEDGRAVLLDPDRGLLRSALAPALLPSTSTSASTSSSWSSPVRQAGVARTLRNLCFEANGLHATSLLMQLDTILPALLLQLASSDPYSAEELAKMRPPLSQLLARKRRLQTNVEVRRAAAEGILVLAGQSFTRALLWENNAHGIIHKGYELEEDPEVMSAMERFAAIIMTGGREEPDAGEDAGNIVMMQ